MGNAQTTPMSNELCEIIAEALADKLAMWRFDCDADLQVEADRPTRDEVIDELREQASVGDNFFDHGYTLTRGLTREIREHAVEHGYATPLRRDVVTTESLARRVLWTIRGIRYEFNTDDPR